MSGEPATSSLPCSPPDADRCMKANRGSPIATCPQAEIGHGGNAAVCLYAKWLSVLLKDKPATKVTRLEDFLAVKQFSRGLLV